MIEHIARQVEEGGVVQPPKYTQEQVLNIEELILGQHTSDAWKRYRKGVITASNIHSAKTKMDTVSNPHTSRIKTDPASYRPICLTSNFCNLIERMVSQRLYCIMEI